MVAAKLNLLTSHLLVKVGFLDSKFYNTFGGQQDVSLEHSYAHFKALEVSYNFEKNSILQKAHLFL